MQKLTIKFEIVVSKKNYEKSGFKDLVEIIQSGQWDKDTLKENKVESCISSAIVEDIKSVEEVIES